MQGLVLHALITPADVQDRDGGLLLLSTLFGMFPFLKKLFADSAYQGRAFQTALASVLPHLETEIIKRPRGAKGFVALPKRWIVERSIGWLNRCRRLAKDWENLNISALIFLRLASISSDARKAITAGKRITITPLFRRTHTAIPADCVRAAARSACS